LSVGSRPHKSSSINDLHKKCLLPGSGIPRESFLLIFCQKVFPRTQITSPIFTENHIEPFTTNVEANIQDKFSISMLMWSHELQKSQRHFLRISSGIFSYLMMERYLFTMLAYKTLLKMSRYRWWWLNYIEKGKNIFREHYT